MKKGEEKKEKDDERIQKTGEKKKISDDDEGSERVKLCVRKNGHDRQAEEDKEAPEERERRRKNDGVIKEGDKER